jgi:hypothetical protein
MVAEHCCERRASLIIENEVKLTEISRFERYALTRPSPLTDVTGSDRRDDFSSS